MSFQIYTFLLLLTFYAIAGGQDSSRIIGGHTISISSYPYLVSIQKNGRHHCGGAIVSDRHILTAAHCIHGHIARPYNGVTVVSGTDSLLQGGESHLLSGAYTDSNYDPHGIKHDIGILVLADRISFNTNQKPVSLPSSDFADYSSAVIVGFGRSQQFLQQMSTYLKALELQIVHPQICSSYRIIGATAGQLCGIQTEGQGTCHGDSGGPLVSEGQVVGVVSHGTTTVNCGLTPDIYTHVYYYMNFIRKVMANY